MAPSLSVQGRTSLMRVAQSTLGFSMVCAVAFQEGHYGNWRDLEPQEAPCPPHSTANCFSPKASAPLVSTPEARDLGCSWPILLLSNLLHSRNGTASFLGHHLKTNQPQTIGRPCPGSLIVPGSPRISSKMHQMHPLWETPASTSASPFSFFLLCMSNGGIKQSV